MVGVGQIGSGVGNSEGGAGVARAQPVRAIMSKAISRQNAFIGADYNTNLPETLLTLWPVGQPGEGRSPATGQKGEE